MDDPDDGFDVLVFSKTAGYRHASIPAGIAAIQTLGARHGFGVHPTEDAAQFEDRVLGRYAAVVWLSTTGTVLDREQKAAFERYISTGGGYVGVHAAAGTEFDWPWYGGLVGAYFVCHPHIQQATVTVSDRSHPSTSHLPEAWRRTDEWYNYATNPRPTVRVLATVEESSYDPGSGAMGADHPIAWCHEYAGGRSWYTGMGHTEESFAEPAFRTHLLGGILAVTGRAADVAAGGR